MNGTGFAGVTRGQYGNHGSGIGVNVAGAYATGAAGTFATVPFDATNDNVPTVDGSLSSGVVTISSDGQYCIGGTQTVGFVPGLTGAEIECYRNGVLVGRAGSRGLTLAAADVVRISFCFPLEIAENDTIDVRIASFGAGGAPVVAGRDNTFLVVEAI